MLHYQTGNRCEAVLPPKGASRNCVEPPTGKHLYINYISPRKLYASGRSYLEFEGNLANKSIYSGEKDMNAHEMNGVNVEQIYSNRSFHHQAVERALQLGLNENSRVVLLCFGHKCAYSQGVIWSWAYAGINNSRATETLFISGRTRWHVIESRGETPPT